MRQKLSKILRRCVAQAQRGDAQSFEFSIWMLPLAIMVTLIGVVAVIRPAQYPVWVAARECARNAITTLDAGTGVNQGIQAGYNSLRGNHLNSSSASINVSYGSWERGSDVTCTVAYKIDVSGIPLIQGVYKDIPMQASVTLQIEPLKSRWK